MADGVYSNGLPHPSRQMRARIALELGAIAFLTVAFLTSAHGPDLWAIARRAG